MLGQSGRTNALAIMTALIEPERCEILPWSIDPVRNLTDWYKSKMD